MTRSWSSVRGAVGIVTLNRPQVLNAWNAPMRSRLVECFDELEGNETVRAIILTGAGERAFGAGQDLNETKTFDPDRAEAWMGEWERLYDRIRSLSKPLIAALNGGSPPGPPFRSRCSATCASATGASPLVSGNQLRHRLGDRALDHEGDDRPRPHHRPHPDRPDDGCEESLRIGLINRIVPKDQVMAAALALAEELAAKAPVAMRLNKARFREVTEASFRECLAAGIRNQREAYATGEPARMMEAFLAQRAARKSA